MDATRIIVFDTTLRDGDQAPGCSIRGDQKALFARRLEDLGVDVIEAGFPAVSKGELLAVNKVAAQCRRVTVAALARAIEEDVIKAGVALEKASRPRIHVFIGTSDLHIRHKLKKTRTEVLGMACRAVKLASGLAAEVEFSAEDATRSDNGFLCDVLSAAVEAGASIINIPDTVGYALPSEYAELIRTIKEKGVQNKSITISAHCHNDLGLAVANSLAAIEAGARQVECTINGIGERAGNAALEEVVMAMRVRSDKLPFTTNIRSEDLYSTSQALAHFLGVTWPANKPIVGLNAFSHKAGIHQDGVMKNPKCYEIMTPETVGAPRRRFVFSKHSGRHALAQHYKELGISLSLSALESAYEYLLEIAECKKDVTDEDLLSFIDDRPSLTSKSL
jgi:2-isopropylmalate synthase